MENEFYRHYKDRVVPALRERHKYKNVHQIPRVHKVVINTSVGSQPDIKQALDEAKVELALITGQQPAETRSKKSIANFKLRKDQIIGAKVTLRGDRMYEFLERLIKAALPRIRDFRGVSPRCFDGNGNYTLGVPDQTIFPEIEIFVPYSKLKAEVVRILKNEGYISDYEVDTKAAHPRIKITNKLVDHTCAITGLKRVSRPGLRRYVGAGEIPRVLGGMGTAILSTSRGIMSGREAKKQKVGGELLAYVW